MVQVCEVSVGYSFPPSLSHTLTHTHAEVGSLVLKIQVRVLLHLRVLVQVYLCIFLHEYTR